MKLPHLARRFVRALWPGAPPPADVAWVESVLTPAELALWRRLPNHDRRYSIRVGRRVDSLLGGSRCAPDDHWVAIALLHDVGKLDAGLGVARRALATVAGAVFPGVRRSDGRFGRYLRHDEIGATMIRAAGGREDAARWAAAHHHRDRWGATGIPSAVTAALDAADNV
ncbi:MAG TPA: HD domain-containing protein [Acidimicrobiia bacterium]